MHNYYARRMICTDFRPRGTDARNLRICTSKPLQTDIVFGYHFTVAKHDKTLEDVLQKKANIPWSDIESMMKHYGAEISEGRGIPGARGA